MNAPIPYRRSLDLPKVLTFAPLAFLKLQFFCHAGDTEIGGFGVSAEEDLLYIEDFVTVRQQVTPVSVRFDDAAVADWFDCVVDRGLDLARCARIWLHTHPGSSVTPSSTDEETFARVFGNCDWAVMFILGRTGQTYARLAFAAGPGGHLLLPVQVDWSAWPEMVSAEPELLQTQAEQWQREYAANIQVLPEMLPTPSAVPAMKTDWDSGWWDLEPWGLELDEVSLSRWRKECPSGKPA